MFIFWNIYSTRFFKTETKNKIASLNLFAILSLTFNTVKFSSTHNENKSIKLLWLVKIDLSLSWTATCVTGAYDCIKASRSYEEQKLEVGKVCQLSGREVRSKENPGKMRPKCSSFRFQGYWLLGKISNACKLPTGCILTISLLYPPKKPLLN